LEWLIINIYKRAGLNHLNLWETGSDSLAELLFSAKKNINSFGIKWLKNKIECSAGNKKEDKNDKKLDSFLAVNIIVKR